MTFIELLFSILIASILLSTLTLIYFTTQKNLTEQIAWQTIQNNGLTASQILIKAIQTAGFIGCAKLRDDFPLHGKLDKIKPYYQSGIKPNTDAITVMRANPASVSVIQGDYLQVFVKKEALFTAKETVLVSDCASAEIAKLVDVKQVDQGQILIFSKPLHKIFSHPAELSLFEVNTFFILRTERFDKKGLPIDALYLQKNNGEKIELVEGVIDMKIYYGVLQNHRLVEKKADEIQDWSKVQGVSIMLELDGLNESHIKKKQYFYVQLRE